MIPSFARLVQRALVAGRRALDSASLEQALLEARDNTNIALVLPTILKAMDRTREILREEFEPLVLETLVSAGEAAARSARAQGGFGRVVMQDVPEGPIDPLTPAAGLAEDLVPVKALGLYAPAGLLVAQAEPFLEPGPFSFEFDKINPEATRWAAEESATEVTGIDQKSRDAVTSQLRKVIAGGFADGITLRRLARQIRRIVGLTAAQQRAVTNLIVRLQNANGGTLVRAGLLPTTEPGVGRSSIKVRVPPGGASAELIERVASRYANLLLNKRALLIARTETIRAANEGQRQLWLQSRAKGLIPSGVKRIWLITPDDRLCPVCRGMAGQVRPLNEPFDTGRYGLVMGPPAHPAGRCATALAVTSTTPIS